MAVGNIEALDLGIIPVRGVCLFDGVFDCFSVCIFVQPGKGPGPVIRGGHRLTLHRSAVRQQVHGHMVRTLTVLIVRVLPGLGPGHADLLRCIAVRDDKAVLRIARYDGRISFCARIDFLQRIFDPGSAVVILVHIQERADPVFFRGQCDHGVISVIILRDLPVPQQRDGDTFRALPVLISGVLPVLDDRHAGLAGSQYVGNV